MNPGNPEHRIADNSDDGGGDDVLGWDYPPVCLMGSASWARLSSPSLLRSLVDVHHYIGDEARPGDTNRECGERLSARA